MECEEMHAAAGGGGGDACTQLLTYACLPASPPSNENAISAQGKRHARAGLAVQSSTSWVIWAVSGGAWQAPLPSVWGAFQRPGI